MKIFKNILKGASFGITIGFLISLIVSSFYEGGVYYPSSPNFVSSFPREVDAIWYSIVIWTLIGLLFTCAGLIFTIEDWSLLKKTFIHFIVTLVIFSLIFKFTGWTDLSIKSYMICVSIFCLTYIIIWTLTYKTTDKELEMINNKLTSKKIDKDYTERLRKRRAHQKRYSIRFGQDINWDEFLNNDFVKMNIDFISLSKSKKSMQVWCSYTSVQICEELSKITFVPKDKITVTDLGAFANLSFVRL
ncbi:hypothetical protein BG262_08890 [Floricoccus penangensis]|uniref:Uncharacterized protein n=1 Tax=Floricoccus penangensis TaxID=1859475 RepID=A0A9Q5JHT5_9LACT|nr:DUF3021 domain-containing protein [Floricoccus penangensis]OFI47796.1 hypothetical protein BG262_08890 [Floricoccus penangensis]